jgi:amidophosphoribosyltransferase
MCGIVGVMSQSAVNQLIYDALLLLQHRGQDAAGIVTMQGDKYFMHKARGMVRDVFRTRNMRALGGNMGLGQVRYPTAGNAYSEEEAQPFYVNAPYGIVLVHNGNLTNATALKRELFDIDRRHLNTESDTEVLINILAHELEGVARDVQLTPDRVFEAVRGVHRRIKGSYAVVALIAGHGLLAFRDPHGIRPLVYGVAQTDQGTDVMVASESVALDGSPVPSAPRFTPVSSNTCTWRGPTR